MEQFQSSAGVHDVLVERVAPRTDERPVAERRPKAFAAGEHERTQRRQGRSQVGIDCCPTDQFAVEQLADTDVDPGGDFGKRFGSGRHNSRQS